MVEAQKYRIEQEMTNLVNELDRSYLRKMQQLFEFINNKLILN